MIIGYARVSTQDQNLDLQTIALKRAECSKVFTDHGISGGTLCRPALDAAISHLKRGDTLIVWRLDRLGRGSLRPESCARTQSVGDWLSGKPRKKHMEPQHEAHRDLSRLGSDDIGLWRRGRRHGIAPGRKRRHSGVRKYPSGEGRLMQRTEVG